MMAKITYKNPICVFLWIMLFLSGYIFIFLSFILVSIQLAFYYATAFIVDEKYKRSYLNKFDKTLIKLTYEYCRRNKV